MSQKCTHQDQIDHSRLPGSDGCQECLATGGQWVHLRMCSVCGHVGCCDSSPGKHATGHHRTSSHPIVRSFEPGEEWFFCYDDEAVFRLKDAPPAPSHP